MRGENYTRSPSKRVGTKLMSLLAGVLLASWAPSLAQRSGGPPPNGQGGGGYPNANGPGGPSSNPGPRDSPGARGSDHNTPGGEGSDNSTRNGPGGSSSNNRGGGVSAAVGGAAVATVDPALEALPGRWWDESDFARRFDLTADQKKKMDDIFNSNRSKLSDLLAALQKEESALEPLMAGDPPDEKKVIRQIDRVLQAKTDLERANARMLLELRLQLTHEQWEALQAERNRAASGSPHGSSPQDPTRGAAPSKP